MVQNRWYMHEHERMLCDVPYCSHRFTYNPCVPTTHRVTRTDLKVQAVAQTSDIAKDGLVGEAELNDQVMAVAEGE